MKISVTAEDIENGIALKSNYCPIARALKRAGFDDAIVGSGHAYVWVGTDMEFIPLPTFARNFVANFDDRRAVAPFEFELATKLVPAGVNVADALTTSLQGWLDESVAVSATLCTVELV